MEGKKLSYIHKFIKKDKNILFLLHGTGADENDLIPMAEEIDPSASVLSIRGKVDENGMTRFFKRFGDGTFDIEDIKFRANEILEFIKDASVNYGFEMKDLTALGFSNGANIIASILLLHPNTIQSAILLRPTLPLEVMPYSKFENTKLLILSGQVDPYAPKERVERLEEILQQSGAKVELIYQPTGHGLIKEDFSNMKEWYQTT